MKLVRVASVAAALFLCVMFAFSVTMRASTTALRPAECNATTAGSAGKSRSAVSGRIPQNDHVLEPGSAYFAYPSCAKNDVTVRPARRWGPASRPFALSGMPVLVFWGVVIALTVAIRRLMRSVLSAPTYIS